VAMDKIHRRGGEGEGERLGPKIVY